MGSDCEILCRTDQEEHAAALAMIAANEVWRIEDKFSRYQDDNIVAKINTARGRPVKVCGETAKLIDYARKLFEISGGRFDITSGVLRHVWRFNGIGTPPSKSSVRQALKLVGWNKVGWRMMRLAMKSGMEIDLGGIGKEYAVDRAAALLRDATLKSCLVKIGGDLAVTRLTVKGAPWTVGADDSETPEPLRRLLRVKEGAVATSGNARRWAIKGGARYGQILNARTGWPVEQAPLSVTVAADNCLRAGSLSTLAMLQGADAEAFLEKQDVDYWCERVDLRVGVATPTRK